MICFELTAPPRLLRSIPDVETITVDQETKKSSLKGSPLEEAVCSTDFREKEVLNVTLIKNIRNGIFPFLRTTCVF